MVMAREPSRFVSSRASDLSVLWHPPALDFTINFQAPRDLRPQIQHLQQEDSQHPADALVDGERPARDRAAVRVPSVANEAAQGA